MWLLSFAVCQRPSWSGWPQRLGPMIHQHPGQNAHGSRWFGKQTMDEPSIDSTLAAFTATMLEQHWGGWGWGVAGSEQLTASCPTADKDVDEPGQSVTSTGAMKPASTSIKYKYRHWAAPRTGAIIGFASWVLASSKAKGKIGENCGHVQYTPSQ